MQRHEQQKVKKPYCAPTLRVFGALRDITKNVNNQGAMDNPTMKT